MPKQTVGAVDRLPIICAAGKPTTHSESIVNLLRYYAREDFAEKLVKDTDNLVKFRPAERATPLLPEQNQLKDTIAPDLNKSRFLEFKDRFYENLYGKKVPLGTVIPTNSKPDDITNDSRTFGKTSTKEESVYALILPNKCPDEILREYVKWHDKYTLSHGNYFPSEQITRRYNAHFDAQRTYGCKSNVDTTGARMKRILQDVNATSKLNTVSKARAKFCSQHKSKIGQPLRREGKMPDVETVFGRPAITDAFHVKELFNSTLDPENVREYANVTTYRAFATDVHCAPLNCKNPAGRIESQYPRKREVKFLTENLGEETTARQLISPSIPMHFGLSHRDFMIARPKEEIKRIFTKAGFKIKDEEFFEKAWSMALKEWTSLGDKVSIEAFKLALHKIENEA